MEHAIKSQNKDHQIWAAKNGTGTIRNALNALKDGHLDLQVLAFQLTIIVKLTITMGNVLIAIKVTI